MALKEYGTQNKPDYYVTIGGFTKAGQKNPDKIEGYYKGRTEYPDQFNPGKTKTTFMIKTQKGIAGVTGNANLINVMTRAETQYAAENQTLPAGTWVQIDCTGLTKLKSGNTMKTFVVHFDNENVDGSLALPTGATNTVLVADDEVEEDDDTAEETPVYVAPVVKRGGGISKVQELLNRNKNK